MKTKELDKKFKYCERKINYLWSRKLKVEAVFYMSLLVEFFIKEAIINFEKIVEGAVLNYNIGLNPRNLYSRNDIENQPLGYLIKILNTYTKDKDLIKRAKYFSEVRNKCIHKFLDHKIKEINKELRGFNRFYYKLVIDLLKLNVNQIRILNKFFGHICNDCYEKVKDKIIRL